jgi:hypothetical protein
VIYEEFEAQIQAELKRRLLNPDGPRPKTTKEADALYERGMLRMWGLVLDAAQVAGKRGAGDPQNIEDRL